MAAQIVALESGVKTDQKGYRQQFIELALACDVLQFGEFELKSGRISPYFFNAGKFSTGAALAQLGRCYAAALMEASVSADMMFGPAYKGIPLVATTAIALADDFGVDMPFAFNRKEAKAHGEGGSLVGSALQGDVVIVDDVITAGTAIKESVAILDAAGARGVAVLIGLDRCEKGASSRSAVQQVEEESGIQVTSVITLHDIIEWVEDNPGMMAHRDALERYRARYGVV